MNPRKLSLALLYIAILCTLTVVDARAQSFGRLFTVDSTADTVDATPGDGACMDADGKCTLRAAILEANSNPSTRDAIVFALPNPSVIQLSLGELAIEGNIIIVGPGARRLSVERSSAAGTPEFRIFRIGSGLNSVIIRGLKIRKGYLSTGDGAGIFIQDQAKVTLSDVWMTENSTGSRGGGISNVGNLQINRSLFNSNAAHDGGAVDNPRAGTATIVNSTLYQNTAHNGGAITNAGTLLLVNDTLSWNEATNYCASVCSGDGTTRVLNTIFGRDGFAPYSSLMGDFISLGNNIVVNPILANGFTNGVNNDQVSDTGGTVDPRLGFLADNGGDTDTLALLDGSPAIDRGSNCVTDGSCSTSPTIRIRTDQRGRFRGFLSTVDIGAYEATNAISSTVSVVTFVGFGRSNRYLGSFGVLTNAVTNDTKYYPLKPGGQIRLQGLPDGVYVLSVKSKRAGLGFDPFVIVSADLPSISLADQGQDLKVTVSEERSKP